MLFSQQAKQFEEEEGSTNENRHINLACVFQYNVGSYALYIYVKSLWVMLQLSYEIGLSRKWIVLFPMLCTKYLIIYY